jgi:Flp pilus assembly protein TadG
MKPRRSLLKDSSGSILVATVIMLTAFIGLLAVVVDLGHLFQVKSDLQNAADAGALAGARALYLNIPGSYPPSSSVFAAAQTAAINAVKQNYSDNVALVNAVPTAGYWDLTWDPKTKHTLHPTTSAPPIPANWVPAIQVQVDRK